MCIFCNTETVKHNYCSSYAHIDMLYINHGADYMSQLLLLGKFKYGGGPIFKVVLEC